MHLCALNKETYFKENCGLNCIFFQDVCQLPKNEGPCDDKIEQFWYDKDKDECYTFDWGNLIFLISKSLSYKITCFRLLQQSHEGEK